MSRPSRLKRREKKGTPKRTLKIFLFIAIASIAAVFLALLSVNLTHYFASDQEVYLGTGIYWNYNVFFTFLIGFSITPFIAAYVISIRQKSVGV